MALHAASGKVSAQSQSGPTTMTADQTVTVASTTAGVTIGAAKHVLMTDDDAYLKAKAAISHCMPQRWWLSTTA